MSGQPFDNTNRGALFANRDKRSDRAPDYRGTLDVGGVQHDLAAWSRTSKKGTPFLSVKVTPVTDEERARRDAKRDMAALNDDIPF